MLAASCAECSLGWGDAVPALPAPGDASRGLPCPGRLAAAAGSVFRRKLCLLPGWQRKQGFFQGEQGAGGWMGRESHLALPQGSALGLSEAEVGAIK